MGVESPELVSKLLEAYLRDNDVDGIEHLYEDGAIFLDDRGIATGWVEIRAKHRGFLDADLSLALNDSVTFQADGIALVHWAWTVTRPDGAVVNGTSAEVLRRQADGSWKFLIDNSDGHDLVGVL